MDWVLTAISKDRAGIVEDIAAIITSHDGNWVKSSMSRLGGEFAGIVQFTTPAETAADKLEQDLKALAKKGITVLLEVDQQSSETTGASEGLTAHIELTGIDHKGIVREITHLLAEKNVTIEKFETDIFTASMAGEPMFSAKANIRLPADLTIDDLTSATEAIAQDIMVDITLQLDNS